MIWRPLQLSDLPAACGLSRLAGWNQTETDWAGYLAFEPEGCFAVEIDGKLAGTATTLRYGAGLGWVGMVLVHPEHRRHGLGSALLGRAIDYLRARGTESIKLDATPLGRKVYVPLGFRDDYEVTRWEGTLPGADGPGFPAPDPGAASRRAISSLSGEVRPEVLRALADFDAPAFGVRRLPVLAALVGRSPGLSFMAGDSGGRPEGYLIARAGREAVQVGPWVARDAACASGLWERFCRGAAGRRVFLDLPEGNPAARALLAGYQFRVQRSFMRMSLGHSGPPGVPPMIFGTSGAEKG